MKPLLRRHARVLGGSAGCVALLALLTAVSGSPAAARVTGGCALLAGLALTLLVPGGAISEPVRSGEAMLWLQRPVNPATWFAARYLREAFLALSLFLGLMAMAAVAGSTAHPGDPPPLTGPLTFAVLVWAVEVSVLFALSAWNVRRDAAGTILILVALLQLQVMATTTPDILGPWAAPARLIGLPANEITWITTWARGGPPAAPRDFIRVAGWIGSWMLVGTVGLRRTLRHPLPGAPS